MGCSGYDALARVYEILNSDIDYSAWADFFERCFDKYLDEKPSLMLDLACGTGTMTRELAKRGYDMIGVDGSVDMLSKAYSAGGEGILYLCQDMREFELYGTVDAAVCCLDCINHLENEEDLDKCFKLVHNYLIPDGIFIFDVNGRAKFEGTYSDNTYAMEEDGAVCIWQNSYNPKTALCDFLITVFKEDEDGRYERYDEEQRERMYTLKALRSRLGKNGFEFIGAYADYDLAPADDTSERIYIAARCKKTENYENG